MKGLSIVHNDTDGEYLYQEEWKDCEYLIVMDSKNKKLTIHAPNNDWTYDLISSENKKVGDDLVFKSKTIDGDGNKVNVSFITIKKEISGYHNFIKFDYKDLILVYRYIDEDGK